MGKSTSRETRRARLRPLADREQTRSARTSQPERIRVSSTVSTCTEFSVRTVPRIPDFSETQYCGCCVVDLFNGHRTHAGLGGLTPKPRTREDSARANVSTSRWQPHCRGLYQTPIAA